MPKLESEKTRKGGLDEQLSDRVGANKYRLTGKYKATKFEMKQEDRVSSDDLALQEITHQASNEHLLLPGITRM